MSANGHPIVVRVARPCFTAPQLINDDQSARRHPDVAAYLEEDELNVIVVNAAGSWPAVAMNRRTRASAAFRYGCAVTSEPIIVANADDPIATAYRVTVSRQPGPVEPAPT